MHSDLKKIKYDNDNFHYAWWYPPSIHIFIPLIAAGALPFSVAKKNQNATAAPAAMKGSARARTVIATPVNAEER